MSKTRVYKVRLYDISNEKSVISRRMATPEGAAYMGGEIIDGTGYVVDNSELEPGEAWTPLDFEPAALGFKKALDQPKVDGVSAGLRSA
jgi:hypothetical protein